MTLRPVPGSTKCVTSAPLYVPCMATVELLSTWRWMAELSGNTPQNRAYRMRTLLTRTPHGMAISDDERAFFIALGQRIAAQRKTQGITQVDLAERLGISQQAMNSFEKGRRRVPVSLLPLIAQTLET